MAKESSAHFNFKNHLQNDIFTGNPQRCFCDLRIETTKYVVLDCQALEYLVSII